MVAYKELLTTAFQVWRFARRCKVRELHVRNVTVGAIRRHLDRLDEQRRARERRLFSPQQQTLLLPIGFLQLHLMRAVAERQRRLDAQSDTFAPAPPYASFAQPATGSKRTTRGSWPHVAAAPSPDDAYSAADDADDHELNEPAPRGRGVAAESRKPSLPRPARTGQLWALQ